MNKRGRKVKLSEEKIRELIYCYKTERKITGKIKYADIHSYAEELFEEGRIYVRTSESFWRKSNRLGRIMVDEANSVFTNKLAEVDNGNQQNIPNITAIINKGYQNKENLVRSLIPFENLLLEKIESEKKLKLQIKQQQEHILIESEKIKKLNAEKEQLQLLLHQLFRFNLQETDPLSRKKLSERAFNDLFVNPTDFITIESSNNNLTSNLHLVQKKQDKKNKLSNNFKKNMDLIE